MSFESESQEVELNPIADLYKVQIGNDPANLVTHYLTSFKSNVTFEGNLYLKTPIKRSQPSEDQGLNPLTIDIDMPLTDIARKYIANTPVERIRWIITQLYIETGSSMVIFVGDVKSVGIGSTERTSTLRLESSTKIFKTKLPIITHQPICNQKLYEQGLHKCNADSALHEMELTGITISGEGNNEISAPQLAAFADNVFTLGECQTGYGDSRLITNSIQVDEKIILQIGFDSRLQNGSSVTIRKGCDKKPITCETVFNNLENFIGMPNIPSKNIAVWGVGG